jgi:hypothetical protein
MNSKRFIAVALTAAIGMSLMAGCNKNNTGSSDASGLSLETSGASEMTVQTTVAPNTEGFIFKFKNQDLRVNTDMNTYLPSLGSAGTDYSYFEAASCAGLGMSKTYTFGSGSVVINTNPNGNVDVISSIALFDDTMQTPEGVYIGSTKDEVIKVYGTPTEDADTTITFEKNDTCLVFVLNDEGKVNNIIYNALI